MSRHAGGLRLARVLRGAGVGRGHGAAPGEEARVLVLVELVDLDQQSSALPPLLALRPELMHLRQLRQPEGERAREPVGERAAERPERIAAVRQYFTKS